MNAVRFRESAAAHSRKAGDIEWWPITRFLTAPTDRRAAAVWATWLGLTAVSVLLAFLEAKLDWSGMPVTIGGRTLGFTIYPPVAISAFIAFWLGPTYGATTAYLSSIVSGLAGGLVADRALLFALGTPAEVLLLWFLSTILRVRLTLRTYQDWFRFCATAALR